MLAIACQVMPCDNWEVTPESQDWEEPGLLKTTQCHGADLRLDENNAIPSEGSTFNLPDLSLKLSFRHPTTSQHLFED